MTGCKYCCWIDPTRLEDDEVEGPLNYCRVCGRYLRKSVKQKCRNLHSETAETCTLRCDYCGKYAKESDLTTEYTKDMYLICRRCKENA